jgi:DnaA family protein
VAEQLTFELAGMPPSTFATFVAGPNAEVVQTLARIASREAVEIGIVLWGANGAGKTHLLRAAVALASERGRVAQYIAHPDDELPVAPAPASLIAVDCIDLAGAHAQAQLFTLYNTLAAGGGQLVAASTVPPARMPLRDDLRTRLGWGLVFELVPLADADKPAALAAFANARGFRLEEDAIGYLLAHGRRDMGSLVGALIALDRRSLALQRPITIPLIREWLQRDMTL